MINTDERTVICGGTGSGKTTFATWMFKNVGALAVFYNTQLEVRVEQAGTALVYNMNGFRKAYNKGYRKIVFNPNEDDEIAEKELESLIELLFKLGYEINKDAKDTPKPFCYLFIDEIQEYSSKTSKNQVVDRVWKRGRRYGIVGIAISQRPADVSHTILTQSRQHIIFRLGQYEKGYFDTYKIPIFKDSEYAEWLERDYHFLVYDQRTLEKYPPVEIE